MEKYENENIVFIEEQKKLNNEHLDFIKESEKKLKEFEILVNK